VSSSHVATPDDSPGSDRESLPRDGQGSVAEVAAASFKLGLTSFGGPIAHIGYFRDEYVVRRKWLDEQRYADLVALCQFLPGPASSQVGIGLGIMRAGFLGGVVAWLGFTLPSALALMLFGFGVQSVNVAGAGWLHGLKIVAVAVVAQAVWGMAKSLCPDRERATIAILAAIGVLAAPTAAAQLVVIALAGLVGWRLLPAPAVAPSTHIAVPISRRTGVIALVLFFGLLIALPLLRLAAPSQGLALVDTFYRVGSLVFGGGHVVLPMLAAEVVPTGWVTQEAFLAGYGAAQAVPGPLFTFAAYLGVMMAQPPNGVVGSVLALVAIFLPSFFLVVGALPFWEVARSRPAFQAALRGVNAAVVGLLGAALYSPIWTSTILAPTDLMLALMAFGLLMYWKTPPWLVVLLTALGGAALGMMV